MTHIRTQIRQALAASLAGLPTTGANVFPNRRLPLSTGKLPGITIIVEHEDVEEVTLGHLQNRILSVEVNGYAAISDGLDDVLDQIGLEVEPAMAGVGVLGGLLKSAPVLVDLDIGIDETTSTPVGRIRMNYTTTTCVAAAAPDIVI